MFDSINHPKSPNPSCMVWSYLKEDPLKFLTALHRLDAKSHMYAKIEDLHTRMVAARCMEKERSELLNGEYQDD